MSSSFQGTAYRKQRWPMVVAATGLVLLGTGAFAVDAEAVERMVSTIGAILLAVAHVGNWRAVSQRVGRRIAGAAGCGA
ncbi:MerC domain-containing protein [Sphingomonas sp. 2R-10]|uniref:MerC domain-containing protein n=1 Tax=Sphingomonas sp. 2R-10 TaxID=3045148 RepID=UPI000F782938|nr:MerC domain-containing protein [Sphingomonas sp. 2R-10]MDJ0276471.1 MerC domain-containing protein [Sphingomonas sp. 2R-10]